MRNITVETWTQFDEFMAPDGDNQYRSWLFRGQRDNSWNIWSSLSRHLRNFQIHESVWPEQEARILRIFKRKAHLYLPKVPRDDDDFQWLALIQHYGGPTRLPDFTWSPYVAAFFAMETAVADAAVFAFDPRSLPKELPNVDVDGQQRTFYSVGGMGDAGAYSALFLPGTHDVISHADPAALNQRITAQLGTFLVPGSLNKSLNHIIHGLCADTDSALVKFTLPKSIREIAMQSLHNRNVNNASLFPDLNGLAQSLRYELEFHWAFNPRTGEDYPG